MPQACGSYRLADRDDYEVEPDLPLIGRSGRPQGSGAFRECPHLS